MKTQVLGVCLAASAMALISCEEPTNPAKVWGTLDCGACNETFKVQDATLDRSGSADRYGYCENKGGNFKFTVATDEIGKITSLAQYYFYFDGIKGPPEKGALDANGIAIDTRHTTFTQGIVKNVNTWEFSPASADTPTSCYVQRFATPADKELTKTKEVFDYFVKINCGGLSTITDKSGNPLGSVDVELWFSNCD